MDVTVASGNRRGTVGLCLQSRAEATMVKGRVSGFVRYMPGASMRTADARRLCARGRCWAILCTRFRFISTVL